MMLRTVVRPESPVGYGTKLQKEETLWVRTFLLARGGMFAALDIEASGGDEAAIVACIRGKRKAQNKPRFDRRLPGGLSNASTEMAPSKLIGALRTRLGETGKNYGRYTPARAPRFKALPRRTEVFVAFPTSSADKFSSAGSPRANLRKDHCR
jgi:hypothetical protein